MLYRRVGSSSISRRASQLSYTDTRAPGDPRLPTPSQGYLAFLIVGSLHRYDTDRVEDKDAWAHCVRVRRYTSLHTTYSARAVPSYGVRRDSKRARRASAVRPVRIENFTSAGHEWHYINSHVSRRGDRLSIPPSARSPNLRPVKAAIYNDGN